MDCPPICPGRLCPDLPGPALRTSAKEATSAVAALPLGSFIAWNRLSGGCLAGRVF